VQYKSPNIFQRIAGWIDRFSIREFRNTRSFKFIIAGLWGVLFLIVYVYLIPLIPEYTTGIFCFRHSPDSLISHDQNTQKLIKATENSIKRLNRRFAGLSSRSTYMVVNTTSNEFYLYRNYKVIRKGTCSTGSYILLKSGKEQKWIFKTPKGQFRIQGKTTHPVWKKPDWAFVEEGLPIPPPNHHSRYERGVLGDYALSLGHGYLIHGTLYQRYLGLPVTHGCIRLNDEDLEAVYQNLSVGSRVYIY
jgi:hypothetical protein